MTKAPKEVAVSPKLSAAYDRLIRKRIVGRLTTTEENLLRDCEMALGKVPCENKIRTLARYRAEIRIRRRPG